MDLVDQIKKQFSDSDISELSSMIGASEGATRSAVGAARAHQAAADHRVLRGGRHAGQRAAGVERTGFRRRRAPHLRLSGCGALFTRSRQALGRLPWLAPFFLRERRLRPRLDIAALLSRCRWACWGPGVLAGRYAAHGTCAVPSDPPS